MTDLAALMTELRPALHRYAARMTGSIIDGEDIVQDTFAKALASHSPAIENPRGWLFRIAHNAALDLLRRHGRTDEELADMEDPRTPADHALATRAALRVFMQLPVAQRQVVILMDVLGHSLEDIAAITDRSISSIKAALHRGRETLKGLVAADRIPTLDPPTDVRLLAYIDRFNAHDWDAVREMLAEDVHLELVARHDMRGKQVNNYFSNYETRTDWHLTAGHIDGKPAVIVVEPGTDRMIYFVLLGWNAEGKLVTMRDFRYARYVVD
ncbi:MAG: sigma-70 family RNA polymerase sigma factor [Kofleriaceae bacterium]